MLVRALSGRRRFLEAATMKTAPRSCAILLLLASQIAPALAQSREGRSAQQDQGTAADDPVIASLPYWDFNHDGVYTCENWKRYMTQIFNQADRRKRGSIDAEEFEAVKAADPMFAHAEFGYFDDKKKGRITRNDFVDRPSPFFLRYDSKHTCRVARANINAPAPASAAPQRRGRSGMGRYGFGQP
jgi:hypothetical protein